MAKQSPNITVIMTSYNRPDFLKESVPSMLENAGRQDFEFLLWDNASNYKTREVLIDLQRKYGFELLVNHVNVGQQALGHLLNRARGEYFVLTEDDMIWFQPNWLNSLYNAFRTKPALTPKGIKGGFHEEWGVLSTNVLVDEVNNGGMWKRRFEKMMEMEVGGFSFWANIKAGAGAMMFRTDRLRELEAMRVDVPVFNKALDYTLEQYDVGKFPMAQLRDTYIYHAASPFWNQLFPEVWKEKQVDQTIEQAMKLYLKLGRFKFKGNEWILDTLKDGTFKDYAENLHKIFDNGRGRIYSFTLAEPDTRRSNAVRHQKRVRRTGRKASKERD